MKELGISSLIRVKKYRSYRGSEGRACDDSLKRQFDAIMSTISPDNGHRTLNNRAWINEALHLRYDKKVHGKQISKQINIPSPPLQSLFRRFARCEVELPGGTIKLHGTMTPALLRVLLGELKGDRVMRKRDLG